MPQITIPGAPEAGTGKTMKAAPVAVVDDFLPLDLANAMRADIDAHFANPHRHNAETHQVWNYWFVPELYTYLRTNTANIFEPDRDKAFYKSLLTWSVENLGMAAVTNPYLSLYVSGCRQAWHNDSGNGRFAYVYSLTRDERRTTGGETFVMREGDGLRENLLRPAASYQFYEIVAPKFNRLVIFDDRAPHAVSQVEGSMDPVEGRFVLHGHMGERGTTIIGALPAAAVDAAVNPALESFASADADRLRLYPGPISLRLNIDPNGAVDECEIIIDRVVHPDPNDPHWENLREDLCERLEALRFPAAAGPSKVILPVLLGTPPKPL